MDALGHELAAFGGFPPTILEGMCLENFPSFATSQVLRVSSLRSVAEQGSTQHQEVRYSSLRSSLSKSRGT